MQNEVLNFYKTHTIQETIKHFNISKSTLYNRLRGFGFTKLQTVICPSFFSNLQKDLLTGSLLGDGYLTKHYNKKSIPLYSERHCSKQLEYLQWKSSILHPFSRNISTGTTLLNNKYFTTHRLETVRHVLFKELEEKWYKRQNHQYVLQNNKRIKQIPQDIILTPFIIAVWFMDDGRNSPTRRSLYISTDGFSLDECNFLCDKLKEYNIISKPALTRRKQHEIYIGPASYFHFIDMVKPHIHPCLTYKINVSNFKPYKRKPNQKGEKTPCES